MRKSLEHHEHAEHIAHGAHAGPAHGEDAAATHRSNQLAALLVAVLAAGLVLSEQGARHAEIRVQENAIFAADAWAQYQAKATRGTVARDIMHLIGVLDLSTPEAMARRNELVETLKQDQERYDHDPQDGREAIAHRAQHFEEARHHALEQTHAYHNGSATLELGIVLATASAILGSRLLIRLAVGLGVAGGVFAVLGLLAPGWGAL